MKTMKEKVMMSRWGAVITPVCIVAMGAGAIYLIRKNGGVPEAVSNAVPVATTNANWLVWLTIITLIAVCLAALFYMPLSISVNDTELNIHRPLRIKSIPITDIESIKLTQPTMGAKRICGSGGFFGYWGIFSERDLGKYFAYYGKASDCFFVRLKDGRKYMLGCQNPGKIVEYVAARITK